MLRALFAVAVFSSCTKAVECGEGTELQEGKCVVAKAATSPPIPATAPVASAAVAPAQVPAPSPATEPTVAADDPWSKPKDDAPAWEYHSKADSMRGTTTHIARLRSTNRTTFDFPYGSAALDIYLRQPPGRSPEAFVVVVKGQFTCSYDGCSIRVKFDDGKVQKFYAQSGESPDSLFLSNVKGWVSQLKKSERLMIEADFFQEGARQFTFTTKGLTWPPASSPSIKK